MISSLDRSNVDNPQFNKEAERLQTLTTKELALLDVGIEGEFERRQEAIRRQILEFSKRPNNDRRVTLSAISHGGLVRSVLDKWGKTDLSVDYDYGFFTTDGFELSWNMPGNNRRRGISIEPLLYGQYRNRPILIENADSKSNFRLMDLAFWEEYPNVRKFAFASNISYLGWGELDPDQTKKGHGIAFEIFGMNRFKQLQFIQELLDVFASRFTT